MIPDVQEVIKHYDGLQLFGYLCTWVGGVLVNYVNKTKQEGLDWKQYWTHNPFYSVASIFVSIGLFVHLLGENTTDHMTFFSVAFLADNLINRGSSKKDTDSPADAR